MKEFITDDQYDVLIFEIDCADLCCPEQVTDAVLEVANSRGFNAAMEEIHRAMLNDAAESAALGCNSLSGGAK